MNLAQAIEYLERTHNVIECSQNDIPSDNDYSKGIISGMKITNNHYKKEIEFLKKILVEQCEMEEISE